MSSDSTRDRAIDHLLSTSSAADGSAPDCVDAERMAAWAEGALGAAEHQSVEIHLASCARCQAVAAAFARATPEIRPVPVLVFWKRPVVRWAVPLAAAAVLVTAVFLREPEAPTAIGTQARVEPAASTDVAPAPASSAAPASEASASVGQQPSLAANADARARQASPTDSGAREQEAFRADDQLAKASEPPGAAPPSMPGSTPVAAPAMPSVAQAGQPARLESRADSSFLLDAVSVVVRTPDGVARWRVQAGTIARAASPSAGPPAGAGRAGTASAVAGNAAQARASQNEADAPSPTWTPVTIEPPAILVAGSAPSANVAWFVGQRGVVVRTTDGTAFSRVAFPETSDLTAVQASDAQRAVVTTASGRRYATSDGGLIWTLE